MEPRCYTEGLKTQKDEARLYTVPHKYTSTSWIWRHQAMSLHSYQRVYCFQDLQLHIAQPWTIYIEKNGIFRKKKMWHCTSTFINTKIIILHCLIFFGYVFLNGWTKIEPYIAVDMNQRSNAKYTNRACWKHATYIVVCWNGNRLT